LWKLPQYVELDRHGSASTAAAADTETRLSRPDNRTGKMRMQVVASVARET
jgi:hypothetical protein